MLVAAKPRLHSLSEAELAELGAWLLDHEESLLRNLPPTEDEAAPSLAQAAADGTLPRFTEVLGYVASLATDHP